MLNNRQASGMPDPEALGECALYVKTCPDSSSKKEIDKFFLLLPTLNVRQHEITIADVKFTAAFVVKNLAFRRMS